MQTSPHVLLKDEPRGTAPWLSQLLKHWVERTEKLAKEGYHPLRDPRDRQQAVEDRETVKRLHLSASAHRTPCSSFPSAHGTMEGAQSLWAASRVEG